MRNNYSLYDMLRSFDIYIDTRGVRPSLRMGQWSRSFETWEQALSVGLEMTKNR